MPVAAEPGILLDLCQEERIGTSGTAVPGPEWGLRSSFDQTQFNPGACF